MNELPNKKINTDTEGKQQESTHTRYRKSSKSLFSVLHIERNCQKKTSKKHDFDRSLFRNLLIRKKT